MGLFSALNTAVSGLNVNQQQLSTLSQNITNANTANYSNETVNQSASFVQGLAQGVSVASITRSVNEFFNSELRTQTSTNSSATAVQGYYTQIENYLGQPGGTSSIDQSVSSFFSAIQTFANSPSVSAETNAVNAGSTVAGQISGLATSLQNLRLQADNDIGSSINSVNTDLQSLQKVNLALEQASATSQNTSGLLDKRDSALTDLSQYLDISPQIQSNGSVLINTTSGVQLLSNTSMGQLSYTPIVSTQTLINNYQINPIQVNYTDNNGSPVGTPATLATGNVSSAVTTSLTSGKIQGLLSVRDSVIPNILSQLDLLASTLRDKVNAVSNAGVSFPPPNSYTGTRLTAGSSSSAYSGSINIALLNSSGNPVASPYSDETNGMQTVNINLGALNSGQGTGVSSVDNIVNAINQAFTPQNKVELGNINNTQLSLVSNNVPDSGNTLSFGFNLNNISASSANFYVGGVTVLDSTGATVSSSTVGGGVTTTQPSIALAATGTYSTQSGSNVVTITSAGANTLQNGDVIYLNPPASSVNGISANSLGGYFTVSNVVGNSFDISVSGSANSTGSADVAGVTAQTQYSSVASGSTANTSANGVITASLAANKTSPYYTVQANIGTIDSTGTLVTSTVSYRVYNNTANVVNQPIGASSANGSGKLVQPSTQNPLVTATLVDANGNPLAKHNGLYGNQQGYLKITATNSTEGVAIDESNSQQTATIINGQQSVGTNQGFSQYFGLNNFFATNNLTATGDTIQNSAINLAVQSNILANPSLLATATLTSNVTTANPTNFTSSVSSGDNSITQQLAGLSTTLSGFASTGGMASSSVTLSQYAGQIIAQTSTDSNNVTSAVNDSQTLLTGFTKQAQNVSGVNLDQELANTVVYQNAYSASARIITVLSTMFNDLIGIIQ